MRSLVPCPPQRRTPVPGALSFPVPVPRAGRTARHPPWPWRGLRSPRALAGRARAPLRRRPPCRAAAPAPAASPAGVTMARGPHARGARSKCRQAGRRVSYAEQPFEVSHMRRLALRRHAGLPLALRRRRGRPAAGFPYWSGVPPLRRRPRGTPRRPWPRQRAPPPAGRPPSQMPQAARHPAGQRAGGPRQPGRPPLASGLARREHQASRRAWRWPSRKRQSHLFRSAGQHQAGPAHRRLRTAR